MGWESEKDILSQIGIFAADSPSVDAFSRLRVSNPVTLFDSLQQYGQNPFFWESAFSGTGLITNLLNESTVSLSTGNNLINSGVTRQTRSYHRYQPGKSQLLFTTFVFDGGIIDGLLRRVGYFDQNDGLFFELDGSNASVVLRSSTSGVPDDTNRINRNDWTDKLDGTGPSGYNLGNFDKSQIFAADLQWLGVGRVRCYFCIDGKFINFATFDNANFRNKVYMKTACLPIRYEILNKTQTTGINTLRHICGAVISEGGFEKERGLQFSATRPATSLTVTTRRPVLSIRAKTTGPNGVRNTGHIIPKSIDLMAGTNSSIYEIILNPTTLTVGAAAPTWLNVDNQSLCEYSINADTITGGSLIQSGSIPSGSGGARGISGSTFFRDFPLVYTGLLNTQDTLCVVITSIGGNSSINASIDWQEIY